MVTKTMFTNSNSLSTLILFPCIIMATALGLLLSAIPQTPAHTDEGMFPISQIAGLNLQQKGLELSATDIFNPDGVSLIDGICRVNGCTGSFVSPQGLIITNHHCAYRAIQSLSTPEQDYLENGFHASSLEQELHAPGYTVRITESYRDVSEQVLSAVEDGMTFAEQARAIEKRCNELESEFDQQNPELRAEVAEMFAGKSYVLFAYKFIRDVRLVFAPPRSVGTFGGAEDNWEWPRHTGDFSFMRAYVAADGSSADYSPDNVPYQPKRHVQIAQQGANEGDFVFLLGYPGRTARHKTASFLQYENNVRLPYVIDLYQWQIAAMESAGANDRGAFLKHTSRIQSLANVEKRSRGQRKGIARARIVEQRLAEEMQLQQFIDADPERQEAYGQVLPNINRVYAEMAQQAQFELTMRNLVDAPRTLSIAYTLYEAAVERQKPDLERESPYRDRNWPQTLARLKRTLGDLHLPTDRQMFQGMLERAAQAPGADQIQVLQSIFSNTSDFAKVSEEFFGNTQLANSEFVDQCLQMTPDELVGTNDIFLAMVAKLYPSFLEMREREKTREGELNRLYAQLLDVKMQFQKSSFVPDANATLRLTYGKIEGYSPEDAVYKMPVTTLKGVVDKTTGQAPFETPQKILDLYEQKMFGPYMHPQLKQVPVAILYSTDTTGGNSGSPIFNARGQLVGVNFDRAFEATINDFAWNQSYSRSIGVDIRYCLWITGTVYGAKNILDELDLK